VLGWNLQSEGETETERTPTPLHNTKSFTSLVEIAIPWADRKSSRSVVVVVVVVVVVQYQHRNNTTRFTIYSSIEHHTFLKGLNWSFLIKYKSENRNPFLRFARRPAGSLRKLGGHFFLFLFYEYKGHTNYQ
jgi:hypothetical protein